MCVCVFFGKEMVLSAEFFRTLGLCYGFVTRVFWKLVMMCIGIQIFASYVMVGRIINGIDSSE